MLFRSGASRSFRQYRCGRAALNREAVRFRSGRTNPCLSVPSGSSASLLRQIQGQTRHTRLATIATTEGKRIRGENNDSAKGANPRPAQALYCIRPACPDSRIRLSGLAGGGLAPRLRPAIERTFRMRPRARCPRRARTHVSASADSPTGPGAISRPAREWTSERDPRNRMPGEG